MLLPLEILICGGQPALVAAASLQDVCPNELKAKKALGLSVPLHSSVIY